MSDIDYDALIMRADSWSAAIETMHQMAAAIRALRADLSESRCLLESSEAALQEAQRALYRWLPNRIGSEYDDLIAADAMTLMGLESVDGLREIGGEILIELVEKRRLLDEARAQSKALQSRLDASVAETIRLASMLPGSSGMHLNAAPVPAQPAAAKGSTHCDECGCDWLDNGLNPVGCPYCKRNDDKFNPCLNSLVRQVALMMDDCEEHADGTITIDCDISQGFLRRIYDLLNALEDCGYDAIEPQPAAVPEAVAKDARCGLVIHTPLPVFSDGPWIFSETGQSFTGDELNVEAFCRYRNALLAAPVPYGFGHLPQVATEDMQDNMRTALIDQGWTSDSAGEVDFQDIWDAAVVQFVESAEDAYAAILSAADTSPLPCCNNPVIGRHGYYECCNGVNRSAVEPTATSPADTEVKK